MRAASEGGSHSGVQMHDNSRFYALQYRAHGEWEMATCEPLPRTLRSPLWAHGLLRYAR